MKAMIGKKNHLIESRYEMVDGGNCFDFYGILI